MKTIAFSTSDFVEHDILADQVATVNTLPATYQFSDDYFRADIILSTGLEASRFPGQKVVVVDPFGAEPHKLLDAVKNGNVNLIDMHLWAAKLAHESLVANECTLNDGLLEIWIVGNQDRSSDHLACLSQAILRQLALGEFKDFSLSQTPAGHLLAGVKGEMKISVLNLGSASARPSLKLRHTVPGKQVTYFAEFGPQATEQLVEVRTHEGTRISRPDFSRLSSRLWMDENALDELTTTIAMTISSY